jgi:prepilin-type N-terminal cleavage/methylation domain-containing protein
MNNKQAFSFVEMSIVLTVIGLLAAGISISSSLIQQAKLKTIISEQNNYITAIKNFQIQYNALPGDMTKATTVWSSAVGNGDGDGFITWATESYYLWQHLGLSGLIAGSYNGTSQEPTAKYKIGVTWRVEANAASIYTIPASTLNSLELVGSTYFISPVDAYNIDIKIDDGVPSNGWVYTFNTISTAKNCVLRTDTSASVLYTYASTSTAYALSQGASSINCDRMYFYLDK